MSAEYCTTWRAQWIGKRFGLLKVIRQASGGLTEIRAKWRCACACGNTITLTTSDLKHGGHQHCGCVKRVAASWPFPRIVGTDGKPVSPVWRAYERNVTI